MAQNSEQLVRQVFETLSDFNRPAEEMLAFFTEDYRQIVDGKELDLNNFLIHIKALRQKLKALEIDIQHIISNKDAAATVHIAHVTRISGKKSRIKVVAFYSFRDGKIAFVDELTHPLEGKEGDQALGSVQ